VATSGWQAFHEPGVPGAALDHVRPLILDSWSRSRAAEIDPEGLGIRLTDVDRDTEFVRAGSRVLLGMADVLAGTHTSLALTDPAGTMTWRWEPDRALGRQFDRTEIHVGSSMGERLAGTNGIAVALHERRAATVFGTEHYKQAWHGWACAAAPVVHPVHGSVAGAVNIACRVQDANHLMLVVLRSLVNGVRGALQESATARERRLMDAHVRHRARARGPVVTLDSETMIVGDEAAGLELDRATLWSMLRDAGPCPGELAVHPRWSAHAHPVDDGFVLVLHPRTPAAAPERRLTPLEAAERTVILQAHERHHGNKSEMAAYLGISRGTLYERLRRYGLS
jgi:transcriptional regulator of acetoin/glycerol metabolism